MSGRWSGRVESTAALVQVLTYESAEIANHSLAHLIGELPMSRRYVSSVRMAELGATLSDRDRAVISTLVRVRLATGQQLARLHCANYTEISAARLCRRLLAHLVERGLIARLDRRIGGKRAGSAGYVYALDVAGRRLMKEGRARRPWTPGRPFLAHSLAIAELYVRLIETERSGELELLQFATEPDCWRSYFGIGGGRVALRPDGYITTAEGAFEYRWFVEVDRGSEAPATLTRKLDAYRAYWSSGLEQAHHDVFPWVLWLVPTVERQQQLIDVIGRQPADSWRLHIISTLDEGIAAMLRVQRRSARDSAS